MTTQEVFDRSDVSQEYQYAFPYHYIPSLENGHFSQHLYWSWGYSYLAGIKIVLSALREQPFKSMIDIGCGDGRFLREAAKCFPEKRMQGIDYSERAVGLARAMNPDLLFECIDICRRSPQHETYDVVTLIEVLEHIPIEDAEPFVAALAKCQKPGGTLLLTVPHKNIPVSEKHFQHFDSESLRDMLNHDYEIVETVFFDMRARVFERLMNGLLGNKFMVLNNQFLLDMLFNIYRKHYLFCKEPQCKRIFVKASKQ